MATRNVSALALDPLDSSVVYVGLRGDPRSRAALEEGVFVSRDGGITWQPLGEGLDGIAVLTLEVDPTDARRIYACTARGVWRLVRE